MTLQMSAEQRFKLRRMNPLKVRNLSQPLTRHECAKAGMFWDDTTNVCTETAIQIEPEPEAVAPTVLVNINKAS
jgi:hypothetical protein